MKEIKAVLNHVNTTFPVAVIVSNFNELITEAL
ncbi:MAG: 6,7-dimethyl-8-ribityllumazine synthase, partial [bacterium]|nr:6,7-dimethyl-8-ribityllumazine synthase [bacterium]